MPGQAQAQARDILRRCCDDVRGSSSSRCRLSVGSAMLCGIISPPPLPNPFHASAQHLLPTRKYLCLNNFVIKQAEEQ